MASKTEWCDETWNPLGGCEGPERWTGRFRYFPERRDIPLHWKRPRRIAVGLMGEMFAPGVDFAFLAAKVFATIRQAKHHTFIVITKRPECLAGFYDWHKTCGLLHPEKFPNLITGVSVTDQRTADKRIPELLTIPGRHCVSIEPMVGPVDIGRWLPNRHSDGPFIEEVYLGGGDAPLHPDWVRKVRDDCATAKVRFWFKQWGKCGGYEAALALAEELIEESMEE